VRKAFADTLCQLAAADERIIFLTGDMGYLTFDAYRQRFSKRYLNVGVAEAALVDVAAGLALEGYRPICYSIASFLTGRAWEQIKCVNAMRLPIVFAGVGGGYTYANAGPTHHSAEDLGLMCLLPGMTVTAPGCPEEVNALLPQLLALQGPSYMRLGRYGEPNYPAETPVTLGKIRRVATAIEPMVHILCAGALATVAVQAIRLLPAERIRATILQAHTLKPFDASILDSEARRILVVQEHLPQGGLYDTVCRWRNGAFGEDIVVERVGPADAVVSGTYQPITPMDIVNGCRRVMRLCQHRGGYKRG